MKRSNPDLSRINTSAHSNAEVTPSSNASTRSSTQPTETMYEGSESVGWGGTCPPLTSSMFESLSRAADRILSGPEEAYKPLTEEERRKEIEESLELAAAMPPFSEVLKLEEEYWAGQNKLLGHDKTDISFDH